VWFDVVSLVPANTWKSGGVIRADLGTFLANEQPKFIRFPGGCYVEGVTLDTRFNWKNTLGNIEDRPGHWDHNWGYWSEDGLGLFEYFTFIEQLGAIPIWVLNNGIAHTQQVTPDKLQGYIQDALDSIEFAIGSTNTTYGSQRAAMGHPAPFNLQYIAIGNEGNIGGPSGAPYYGMRENYMSNYELFYSAIKAQYPNMNLIANADMTDWYGQSAPTDIYDFHVYSSFDWFIENINQWDTAPRNGPKVFVSEYADTQDCGQGNLRAAVAEAAYMTGMERNSDVVILASYAPLFVNNNDRTWNPDTIVFNDYQVFGTASYWAQLMFAQNSAPGAVVLNTTFSGASFAISSTYENGTQEVVFKLVNYGTTAANTAFTIQGASAVSSSGQLTTLTSGSLTDENSFANPLNVSPKTNTVSTGSSFSLNIVANSVNVLRVGVKL